VSRGKRQRAKGEGIL